MSVGSAETLSNITS